MAIELADIAVMVNGNLAGDGRIHITGAGSIETAREGEIAFIDRPELLAIAEKSPAAALIAPANAPRGRKPMILTEDPRLAFSKVLELFAPKPYVYPGIHPRAILGEGVKLGTDVSIGASAYVGSHTTLGDRVIIYPMAYIGEGVTIGDDTVIHPLAFIGDRCHLGSRVNIHPGASIGGDGFGYVQEGGRHRKIPQIGNVIVGDDVEIGANSTVDRATVGATRIGRGTKIDDQVHIAHNVVIGEDCLICGQVGISGSAQIGDRVIMAGQVGVNDHIKIGSDIVIGGQAGIFSDLPEPGYYSGYPARPHNHSLRVLAATQKLPELVKRLRELEKLIAGRNAQD
ncbi:MAG: UDP-3-O-(3-hydroxymyristoyl)glucosamine N-acyltransferase [Candidatus Zipacnadales bacterium]